MLAESGGKKVGAFNTSKTIVELLIKLIKPKEGYGTFTRFNGDY